MRFLLAQLLTSAPADFESVDEVVPYVGGQSRAPRLLPDQGRLLKSHEPYSPLYEGAYGRLVYVVRDGRDVAVSYFHTQRGLGWFDGEFPEFLRLFLAGRADGYGPWHEHVRGWLGHRDDRGLLEVRFEALLERPEETLALVSEHLGIAATPGAVKNAVDANSAHAMRGRERTSGPEFPADPNARFVRAARAGSWQEQFSEEDLARFLEATGGLLGELGYAEVPETPSARPATG
jgi:hypothetical protein